MMTAAKALEEVLASARARGGDDLEPFVAAALKLRASTVDRSAEHVTPSVLIAAAVEVNSSVLSWLRDSGFDRIRYEESLGRRAMRGEVDEESFPLDEQMVEKTFGWWAKTYPDRMIDVAGIAISIVATADGDVRRRLIQAGLRIDEALNKAEEFDPVALMDFSAVSAIPMNPLVTHIMNYAASSPHARRFGRLTSSGLVIAMLDEQVDLGDSYPAFLRSRLGMRVGPELPKTVPMWLSWYEERQVEGESLDESTPVTRALYELIRDASEIALRVTGTPRIHGRHLIGAILLRRDTDLGSAGFIHWLEIDLEELTRDFLSQLEEEGAQERDHDDLRAWRRLLRIEDPSAVPRYDSEGYSTSDHLEIGTDVDAFATLIASKTLQPPLSIGLFGDWGSGKSFFMSQLRDAIDDLAGSSDAFHKKVVQIEFNAWHYVEANLWASLVENIFRNLRAAGEKKTDVEARRKAVMEKIDDAALKRAQREAVVEQKKIERDTAEQALEKKKTDVENSARRLSLERVRDIWESLEIPDATRQTLAAAMKAIGVDRAMQSTEDVRATVDEIRSLGGRTRLFWVWLTQKSSMWGWALLLVLIVALPFAAAMLHAWLSEHVALLKDVSAQISEFAGLAGAAVAWIGVQLKRGRAVLGRLESAKEQVEGVVKAEENKKKTKIRDEESALESSSSELTKAQNELATADQELKDAQKELLDLSPGRQLARFIDDRAASNDYRRLLGVLATARNDFETLSALMRQQDDPTLRRRFPDLARLDEKHRIDRIVLYIDDLDRCPPGRVVEVLQAVHLLLAFKLFVVVVGVDARWVSEALEYKYRDVWRRNRKDGRVPGHTATPRDYLEKIFQIPFWLKAIDAITTKRFVGRLLESDLGRSEDADGGSGDGGAQARQQAGGGRGSEEPRNEAESRAAAIRVSRREHLSNPTQLTLQAKETEYMKELAELIGRSPRTVKRYINTYRIIRAAIPPRRLNAFLDEKDVADYQTVLLLLAVVVGTPQITNDLFRAIEAAGRDTTVADMVSGWEPRSDDWARVAGVLKEFAQRNGGRPRVHHLVEHIPQVSRYSFDTLASA